MFLSPFPQDIGVLFLYFRGWGFPLLLLEKCRSPPLFYWSLGINTPSILINEVPPFISPRDGHHHLLPPEVLWSFWGLEVSPSVFSRTGGSILNPLVGWEFPTLSFQGLVVPSSSPGLENHTPHHTWGWRCPLLSSWEVGYFIFSLVCEWLGVSVSSLLRVLNLSFILLRVKWPFSVIPVAGGFLFFAPDAWGLPFVPLRCLLYLSFLKLRVSFFPFWWLGVYL